jgi:hypothetical protein
MSTVLNSPEGDAIIEDALVEAGEYVSKATTKSDGKVVITPEEAEGLMQELGAVFGGGVMDRPVAALIANRRDVTDAVADAKKLSEQLNAMADANIILRPNNIEGRESFIWAWRWQDPRSKNMVEVNPQGPKELVPMGRTKKGQRIVRRDDSGHPAATYQWLLSRRRSPVHNSNLSYKKPVGIDLKNNVLNNGNTQRELVQHLPGGKEINADEAVALERLADQDLYIDAEALINWERMWLKDQTNKTGKMSKTLGKDDLDVIAAWRESLNNRLADMPATEAENLRKAIDDYVAGTTEAENLSKAIDDYVAGTTEAKNLRKAIDDYVAGTTDTMPEIPLEQKLFKNPQWSTASGRKFAVGGNLFFQKGPTAQAFYNVKPMALGSDGVEAFGDELVKLMDKHSVESMDATTGKKLSKSPDKLNVGWGSSRTGYKGRMDVFSDEIIEGVPIAAALYRYGKTPFAQNAAGGSGKYQDALRPLVDNKDSARMYTLARDFSKMVDYVKSKTYKETHKLSSEELALKMFQDTPEGAKLRAVAGQFKSGALIGIDATNNAKQLVGTLTQDKAMLEASNVIPVRTDKGPRDFYTDIDFTTPIKKALGKEHPTFSNVMSDMLSEGGERSVRKRILTQTSYGEDIDTIRRGLQEMFVLPNRDEFMETYKSRGSDYLIEMAEGSLSERFASKVISDGGVEAYDEIFPSFIIKDMKPNTSVGKPVKVAGKTVEGSKEGTRQYQVPGHLLHKVHSEESKPWKQLASTVLETTHEKYPSEQADYGWKRSFEEAWWNFHKKYKQGQKYSPLVVPTWNREQGWKGAERYIYPKLQAEELTIGADYTGTGVAERANMPAVSPTDVLVSESDVIANTRLAPGAIHSQDARLMTLWQSSDAAKSSLGQHNHDAIYVHPSQIKNAKRQYSGDMLEMLQADSDWYKAMMDATLDGLTRREKEYFRSEWAAVLLRRYKTAKRRVIDGKKTPYDPKRDSVPTFIDVASTADKDLEVTKIYTPKEVVAMRKEAASKKNRNVGIDKMTYAIN